MNTETNKPLTVEEAARKWAIAPNHPQGSKIFIHRMHGFEAGAKWKEKQYKEALQLANQLAAAVYLKEKEMPQLLLGYTNEEVFHKLQQVLYNDNTL